MDRFVLPIFPEGSLSASVVTTVWLGVFVCALGNLRLGWTFSGLVVPGYIVPLLIVKPWSALVIIVEAILAYFLVWLFSQYLSRFGRWSGFFGRDRFFALVLSSIFVRILLDGYVLPHLARVLAAHWLTDFDFAANLHSFGLIIIALIANQFWKPGLRRGLVPFVVTVGATYLLVRYPLMSLTNFSVGSLEHMYEDVSASVLASPKSYIVLVCTAFLASRMNLYYSWEFNGIVIPSLLALQWYEPLKILTSFVEAWVIYLLASRVMRLPWLRGMTIEGARKILLFFNLSFAYKMLLGHLVYWIDPGIQATDCFGFGYLLPSLIACKMHDKGIPERMTRTTLQVSIAGAAAASVVGFALTFVPQDWALAPATASAESAAPAPPKVLGGLVEQLREEKLLLYGERLAGSVVVPTRWELDAFMGGLRELRSFVQSGQSAMLENARKGLRRAGFRLTELEGELFHIGELPPRGGRGVYVVSRKSPRGLVVEVPAPLKEWATLESGAYLFRSFGGSALAVATAEGGPGGESALTDRRSFFHAFHQVFGYRDVVQVRGYTDGGLRALDGDQGSAGAGTREAAASSRLWVESRLPPDLALRVLDSLLEGLEVEWREPPFPNVQRQTTSSGFAELFLRREDRKRLLARFLLGIEAAGGAGTVADAEAEALAPGGASLRDWLLARRELLAPRGSNLYQPPSAEALLFFDEEVLTPILHLVIASAHGEMPPERADSEIQTVHAAARSLNYRLVRHRDPESGARFLVLTERADGAARRYWGDYVFRLDGFEPFAIEVPHPEYEKSTLEHGVSLFEELKGLSLLVAGAHPKCNTDMSADIVQSQNRRSLFNLVNQVLLRETGDRSFLVVQARAFGHKPGVVLSQADALVSFADGKTERTALGVLGERLFQVFDDDGLYVKFVNGAPETAGYEALGSAQARYLSHTRNKDLASVWLSPYMRRGRLEAAEASLEERKLAALGIPTRREHLAHRLELELEDASLLSSAPAPAAELRRLLGRYQVTGNGNALAVIEKRWPELRLERVVDLSTQRSFLLLFAGDRMLPFVARSRLRRSAFLGEGTGEDFVAAAPLAQAEVRRFIESESPFLVIGRR
jgi:hypothetical protein